MTSHPTTRIFLVRHGATTLSADPFIGRILTGRVESGKLTTGVTVPQWSSILMLRNLKSPETYFQAAFRVQSPWSIKNPNGDDPNEEEILKPVCFVFDFAPTRALRQLSEYGIGLSPNEPNPENAVKDLVSFLPVLAYDGANMTQIDAGGILDIALAGTSATLLARKWKSALLVNVDNNTLRRILDNPEAMAAVERIEGWHALGDNIIETIINKSDKVRALKNKAKEKDLSAKEKRELSDEEREYKSKRKLVQEKLIKFATRIPAFMYLTDFRENTLQDVITKLEPDLFRTVTGLTVKDFHLLVRLKVFNTEQMNQAVFAFRRYKDASLRYTGINSHERSRRRHYIEIRAQDPAGAGRRQQLAADLEVTPAVLDRRPELVPRGPARAVLRGPGVRPALPGRPVPWARPAPGTPSSRTTTGSSAPSTIIRTPPSRPAAGCGSTGPTRPGWG